MTPKEAEAISRARSLIQKAWETLDYDGPDRASVEGWINDLQLMYQDMGNLKLDA